MSRLGPWSKFNCSFSCSYILDPRDPLFSRIGALFLAQVVKQFGTNHVYNTDTFNEMTPPSSDPTYLAAVSRAVFASMTAGEGELLSRSFPGKCHLLTSDPRAVYPQSILRRSG